ncbi:MAG: sugar ABC transporter permease [Spirochaetia bacterium]|nr:sugar ABC transporter permease [Spirochaetia bacterium]
MLTPALILLALFVVTPFIMSIPLSFTNQKLFPSPIPVKIIGLRNFRQILSDREFWQAIKNVFLFTLMILPTQCGFALLAAYFLNKQAIMKKTLRAMFFLPFITPMVIVTVIWATIYKYPTGLLNSFFQTVIPRFQEIDWLGNRHTALTAIVFLSAWQAYGFQMVIYLAGLQNIPEELYEAAAIDGAGGWKRFIYVTWPGLKNTTIFVLTITTIQALKLFTQVNILTHGGPLGSTNTLVHYMYEAGFIGQKIGYSAASSILMFLLVFAVVLAQRLLLKRMED